MSLTGLASNIRCLTRRGTKSLFQQLQNGHQLLLSLRRQYPAITAFQEGDGKTSITILNKEPDAPLMINSFSQMGFRLNNGMAVIGPIAIFPKTVLCWNIAGPEAITADSLCLFTLLAPRLDLLIVGVGDTTQGMDTSWLFELKKKKVNVEVFTTQHACSTFNFLNVEKRYVAAALIPPTAISFTEQDVFNTKLNRNEFDGVDREDPTSDDVMQPDRRDLHKNLKPET